MPRSLPQPYPQAFGQQVKLPLCTDEHIHLPGVRCCTGGKSRLGDEPGSGLKLHRSGMEGSHVGVICASVSPLHFHGSAFSILGQSIQFPGVPRGHVGLNGCESG